MLLMKERTEEDANPIPLGVRTTTLRGRHSDDRGKRLEEGKTKAEDAVCAILS
jgi:hypothetical protein